jgi:hypothetical protein
VIEAIENDPNTISLLNNNKEEDYSLSTNKYYYYCNSLLSDPAILQMAEESYERVLNVCIQNTMNWAPIKYQQDLLLEE